VNILHLILMNTMSWLWIIGCKCFRTYSLISYQSIDDFWL